MFLFLGMSADKGAVVYHLYIILEQRSSTRVTAQRSDLLRVGVSPNIPTSPVAVIDGLLDFTELLGLYVKGSRFSREYLNEFINKGLWKNIFSSL